MGNRIGIYTPSPVQVAVPVASRMETECAFRSIICLWTFSRGGCVQADPLAGLPADTCTIVVHLSSNSTGTCQEVGSRLSPDTSILSWMSNLMLSVAEDSVLEPVSGWECNWVTFTDKSANLAHSIYVWRGAKCSEVVYSNAIAYALDLDRWLLQGGNGFALSLFHSKAMRLDDLFNTDLSSLDSTGELELVKLLQVHHLFRVLYENRNKAVLQPDFPDFPVISESLRRLDVYTSTPPESRLVPPLSVIHPSSSSLDGAELSEGKKRELKMKQFDSECSRVLDCLYVGSATVAADYEVLCQLGITYVVNAAGLTCPDHFPQKFIYTSYFVADGPDTDLFSILLHFCGLVNVAQEQGGKVFVHCHQGVSRSCSLVIGYLMATQSLGFNEAFEVVRAARPVCSPNPGFIGQLLLWRSFLDESHKQIRRFELTSHGPEGKVKVLTQLDELNHLDPQSSYIVRTGTSVVCFCGMKEALNDLEMFVRTLQSLGVGGPTVYIALSKSEFLELARSLNLDARFIEHVPNESICIESPGSARVLLVREGSPSDPHEDSHVSPFLCAWPSLEELSMFDTDDLCSTSVFVLFDETAAVHVWLGENSGVSVSDAFLRQVRMALEEKYPARFNSETELFVQTQGSESEKFWDGFING